MNDSEPMTWDVPRRDLARARTLAAEMGLSLEEYLRRAVRIVNAETEAFLSVRRGQAS